MTAETDVAPLPRREFRAHVFPRDVLRNLSPLGIGFAGATVGLYFLRGAPNFAAILAGVLVCALYSAIRYGLWMFRVYGQPTVILDSERIRLWALSLTWRSISRIVVCQYSWREYVGMATMDDKQYIAMMPAKARPRLVKNVEQCGVPLLIPAMRGISAEDLRQIIQEYHDAAVPK